MAERRLYFKLVQCIVGYYSLLSASVENVNFLTLPHSEVLP